MVAEPTEVGRNAYRFVSAEAERARLRRKVYTAAEVAEQLGCSADSVYKLARAGRIPHIAVGRNLKFPREAVDLWMTRAALAAAGMEEQP